MSGCRIVVGVDGPLGSGPATDWAAERASLETGRVLLLHVASGSREGAVRTGGFGTDPTNALAGDTAAALPAPPLAPLLSTTLQRVRERRPAVEVTTREVPGRPDEVLGALGREADLVVVGRPHRRHLGWRRSTCRQLLTRGGVPLVVVPAPVRDRSGPVVVGVDTGSSGGAALRFAAREARLRGVPLVAVHAWGDDDRLGSLAGGAGLDDELDALLLLDRLVTMHLPDREGTSLLPLRGAPMTQLMACSWQAQLVVVGGARPAKRRLRTLPESLLRAGIRTPLAVVP